MRKPKPRPMVIGIPRVPEMKPIYAEDFSVLIARTTNPKVRYRRGVVRVLS